MFRVSLIDLCYRLIFYSHACIVLFHLQDAQRECLLVNAPLICRAASRVPFSVLKYAMTLDGEIDLRLLERSKLNIDVCICLVSFYPPFDAAGKIAASSGHASWISCKQSRNLVFELRGRSDAVIVGGNTVRRDSEYHCYCLQISLNLYFYSLPPFKLNQIQD